MMTYFLQWKTSTCIFFHYSWPMIQNVDVLLMLMSHNKMHYCDERWQRRFHITNKSKKNKKDLSMSSLIIAVKVHINFQQIKTHCLWRLLQMLLTSFLYRRSLWKHAGTYPWSKLSKHVNPTVFRLQQTWMAWTSKEAAFKPY